jgi:hypothetical protein
MSTGTQELSAVPRRDLGAERWDRLVDHSDDAWLLHRYAYSEALATWPEFEDESFALVDAQGEPQAIFPLQAMPHDHLRGAMKFADLTSSGGPAVAPDADRGAVLRAAVDQARTIASQRRAVALEVWLPPLAPGLRDVADNPLLGLGFEDEPGQTWVVDLSEGEEAVWKGMQGRARTAARKAEKNGVTVREADDVDAYYALHLQTYERTGVRPHPREYFELLWTEFGRRGELFTLFAEHEGEVVAAQTFALYKGAGWYWTSAAGEQGTKLAAPNLLQWEAIKRMIAAGADRYDTGKAAPEDADPKARAISDFKRSMGGELQPLWTGRIDTAPVSWRALRGIKQVVRR